ncbi:response regulator [Saccharicrinis sp. 156]|uniref:response regulator n=1 Tax=Saccharicrinis sp. 156 TaxID=3417574 RepID=UPI003D33E04A
MTSICTDYKGNYYIGTRLSGLFTYNTKTKKTSVLNEKNSFIKDNNIRSLLLSSNNELWISSEKQLHILNLKNGKHRNIEIPKPNNGLVNFCETDHQIFAGSDKQGLLVFSIDGKLLDTITKFNKNVTQILQQKDGKLIVAAHSVGCFIYDYKNNQSENIQKIIAPTLKNLGQIVTIYLDSKENLWIGNFKFGLYRISKDKKEVTIYTMKNGLPSNDITGIIEDEKGNMWISTAYGLSMLNKKSEFINYSYNEGLENIQFHQKATLKDEFGTLFFGGNFGLTFFNPKVFDFENKQAPKIRLETLKVSNRQVTPDDDTNILTKSLALTSEITLSHHYPSFSIEYKGFDYVSAKNMKYAYILEGSDTDWNYVDNRTFASYQNLKPGDYIFKARVQNDNGNWSSNLATLNIKIKPAPWLTIWALAGYILFLALLILGAFKFVLYIKHYKKELEVEQNERIRENEVSQMKLRFFTNISHEIRTPVTLIKGNVDYLKSELNEKKMTLNSIGSLSNSTDRLLKLINQLLSFRQLENDALDLEIKNQDIIEITKELVISFQYTAKLKHISIEIDTKVKDLIIPVDKDKYEKILNNLLSNSLKFSKKNGQIKVVIEKLNAKDLAHEFKVDNTINNFIKVSVIDNGKGISPDQLPHIFDRYIQYNNNNSKPDYSSTGIGLNFTKRLIELHHGAIAVTSEKNVLTCMRFILPIDAHVYALKDMAVKEREQTSIFTEELVPDLHKVNKPEKVILLAEDDIELNKFIQKALSGMFQVIPTYDGKDALKLAKKSLPDIIISDVMMPEMDGITLCKSIREDNLISHIPIVLLTAKAEIENKILGFDYGADEYITKPFDLNILKARIQNLIKQRSALQEYYKNAMPVEYKTDTVNQFEVNFMKKINSVVEENYKSVEFNVHLLAEKMNMSRTSFYRKFMNITETPPKDYITNFRINKSLELIHKGYESLGEISFMCGFSSQTIFSNSFRKAKGVLPLQYKKSLKQAHNN